MEKKTLYRYFGNCATEEERIQVLEWTKASPENLKEFCRERNIYNAILLSTDNIQRTKYDFRRHYRAQLLRIAAVVILLLSVAFGSFYLTMGDRIVPLYSLTVPAGNSNTLLLPDGTKVWLNAGSTIKYPSSFLGMQRNIEIEGEAYLEVTHNRWKPFIVNTPNGKVKVLGTKFYVTSTLKEKDFMVSLIGDLLFYPAPMFVSLVTHGIQAIVVSLCARKLFRGSKWNAGAVIGVILGIVINTVGYSLGRAFIYSTPEYAVMKLPYQILEDVVGSVLGYVLCFACGIKKLFEREFGSRKNKKTN